VFPRQLAPQGQAYTYNTPPSPFTDILKLAVFEEQPETPVY
jgi:hypothetical protein